jgi:hypothetical protein
MLLRSLAARRPGHWSVLWPFLRQHHRPGRRLVEFCRRRQGRGRHDQHGMSHSFGRTLVGLVGAAVIIERRAGRARLVGHTRRQAQLMSRAVRRGVEALAKVGLTARAVIMPRPAYSSFKPPSPSIPTRPRASTAYSSPSPTHPSAHGCSWWSPAASWPSAPTPSPQRDTPRRDTRWSPGRHPAPDSTSVSGPPARCDHKRNPAA